MRILIVHSQYLSNEMSGENRVVADDAALLGKAGHEVRLLRPEPQVTGLAAQVRTARTAVWGRSAARVVKRIIETWAPDVVHFHNVYPTLSPLAVRAAAQRAPVVLTLHNYRQMCLAGTFLRQGGTCESCLGRLPWRGVVHGCYRGSRAGSAVLTASIGLHRALRSYGEVAGYVAVSDFVREKHVEAGFPGERIAVRPNFAWPSRRRTGPGDVFLFVGRLSPEKGLSALLRWWADVPADLVVAGDGPEREALRGVAPPNVKFLGYVSPARIENLLGRARGLVVPSVWYEGLPRTVVEAFAAEVPVVATRIGGLADAVEDGRSGILVEAGDVTAWRAAVEQLLDDCESKRLGWGAWSAWRERYSPHAALQATLDIYRTVTGGAPEVGVPRLARGSMTGPTCRAASWDDGIY